MATEEIARPVDEADKAMGEDIKIARTQQECIDSLFKFLSVLSLRFYPKFIRDCR